MRLVCAPGSSTKVRIEIDAAKSPAPTYEPRAAWWVWNHSTPVPSSLPMRVTTSSPAAAIGSVRKFVRSESRRSASRWSGSGRTAAPSAGGAGSSEGAAPSLATVQKRSTTPTTKVVISSQATASAGAQSIHSGAMRSSTSRRPSAPIMVQRRSSGPVGPMSAASGPRSTAPNSTVAKSRTPSTTATEKAAPRYPPPKEPAATDA